MNRNYIGARRKRTNTPVLNRKRAVEYRHRPYAPVKTEKPEIIEEPAVIEEIAETAAEDTAAETAVKETAEEAAHETADRESSADSPVLTAASGTAAVGFFAKLTGAFKGLFSRNKQTAPDSGEEKGIVSDLKTWINSPIDPDEELEDNSAGLISAEEQAEETVFADTDELTEETALEETAEEAAETEGENTEEPKTAEAEDETADSAETSMETGEAEQASEAEDETLTEETSWETEEPQAAEDETETPEDASLETEETEPVSETEEETAAEETAEDTEPLTEETEAEDITENIEEASMETRETEPASEAEEETLAKAETASETEPQNEEAEEAHETEAEDASETGEETSMETEETEPASEPDEETSAEETAAEEPQTEETEETPEGDEEALSEEPAAEPEEAPLSRKEKRELRKEIRRETKTQLLDEIIDSPRAGLLTMLVAPGYAMKKVSEVEKTTLAAPSVLLLNVIKWAAIGTFFTMFIEKFINHFNYSFVRLNFTGTASLAFRFGIFGLIAEYVSWIVIGLFCGLIRRKISTFKLMEVEARSALGVALLFVIGSVLVWKDMFAFGVIAGICGIIVGFMTKGYGMDLVLPIGKNTQLILVVVLVIAAAVLSYSYFPLILSGLTDIFMAILNL